MENRSHALIAGLFMLILGMSAIAALWWFGGKHEEINSYVVLSRRNVTGLNPQAQVRYRGIRVGKVESIRLDPADARTTRINIAVGKNIPITRGTVAKLGYHGVTGIAHILLEDDGTNPQPLPTGNDGHAPIIMQDSLMQELTDVGSDTLRNARDLLENINEILSPANRQAISDTLQHLEATTRQASETTERLQNVLTPENMQRLNNTLIHAEQTVAEAAPFFAEARGLVASLQSASDRFETVLGDSASGGVGALAPRLNELTTEIASASQQLDRVLQMLEKEPQSLIFGRQSPLPGPGEPGFVAPSFIRVQP